MKNIAFLLIFVLASCSSYKSIYLASFDDLVAPPGTTQLSENLYFDLTEVTNFHWLEYQNWIKKYYSENSEEYNISTPNRDVWTALDSNYSEFDKYYLSHPSYRDYPVMGVSYEQAVAYSEWRSDRVMQYILVNNGIIPNENSNHKDSIFTIEKYFTGQYNGIDPNPEIKLYPKYTLPDSANYFKYAQFADSVNSLILLKGKYKNSSLEMLENCVGVNSDSIPLGPSPVSKFVSNKKKIVVSHLKGNVREMTSVKGQFFGLSFIDSCDTSYPIIKQDPNMVNSYTGFRNICVYKKWGE